LVTYFCGNVFLMKNKIPFLFVLGLVLINVLSNSCKKDKQTSIQSLFTTGTWQLSTVIVTTTFADTTIIDTLNTTCNTTQLFTFNGDNTCTYTNFQCKDQPIAKGHWSLSTDQLYLNSDIVCQDTISSGTGSSKPFSSAQIFNLGQYSLVLQTGDLQNYATTKKRVVMRYGFIRQKATTK
jgi:uncharacterized membrane protein YciS (DUF1049 family)